MQSLPKDKEYLVKDNIKLVSYCLKKHIRPNPGDYADLFQQGCLALVNVAIRYDPSYGFAFATYAVPTIVWECKRYQKEKLSTIKYGRSVHDLSYKFYSLLESKPDIPYEEIVKTLGINYIQYCELMAMNRGTIPFSSPLNKETDGIEISGTFGSEELAYDNLLVSESIKGLLGDLLAREKEKTKNIYKDFISGVLVGDIPRQATLSKRYNVSQAQISRLLKRLNKKLATELVI